MAVRPIYLPSQNDRDYVDVIPVTFGWVPGLSISQKHKSIAALHDAARAALGVPWVLEISTKSEQELGRALSAFNLLVDRRSGHKISVECAFQGSKAFERGGPYIDLYERSSREAKRDNRLKDSGRLLAFEFADESWPITPQTAFYDWLYIGALSANPQLADQVVRAPAFSDIEFNPDKSINCQAYSAALFVSLHRRNLLAKATASMASFLEVVGRSGALTHRMMDLSQRSLF